MKPHRTKFALATVASVALSLFLFEASRAESIVAIPPAQAIADMARDIQFDSTAVTDEPVPPEAKKLNAKFTIKVYFRPGIDTMEYRPEMGAIFAKILIAGVPAERLLPDGEYYLWMGGAGELLRAALAKVDGTIVKEVEVLAIPSLIEESTAHAPKVHSVIEVVLLSPGTQPKPPPPKPPPPKPSPPKPPPPKPPEPPRRSWREICVPSNPNQDHGSPNPKKWIRVPDN